MNRFKYFTTTHFWGPVANWGIVGAATYDAVCNGPENISPAMTITMIIYSSLFMRFAWVVKPRNKLLMSCHVFNIGAQSNQLRRYLDYTKTNDALNSKSLTTEASLLTGAGLLTATGIAMRKPMINKINITSYLPPPIKTKLLHPAGPFYIHFWAPTFKWALSFANLADINRPIEKISTAQQTALTATGIIWSRYGMVINPINYNLMAVNIALGLSSGYHLFRKVDFK